MLDISGSMAASASSSSPSRLERAAGEALALRRVFPAIRFGIATITDRTLPVVFPTSNPGVFSLAIDQSIGIERPLPVDRLGRAAPRLHRVACLGQQVEQDLVFRADLARPGEVPVRPALVAPLAPVGPGRFALETGLVGQQSADRDVFNAPEGCTIAPLPPATTVSFAVGSKLLISPYLVVNGLSLE